MPAVSPSGNLPCSEMEDVINNPWLPYVKLSSSAHSQHASPFSPLCPGESHYYILTDTTDQGNAAALGLNHSPKLVYSQGGATTAALDFENVILVDRVGKVSKPPTREALYATVQQQTTAVEAALSCSFEYRWVHRDINSPRRALSETKPKT